MPIHDIHYYSTNSSRQATVAYMHGEKTWRATGYKAERSERGTVHLGILVFNKVTSTMGEAQRYARRWVDKSRTPDFKFVESV